MAETKCAMVALVGLPNVGKSTLINALVGEKVGIISAKPNTTRVVVRGVLTRDENQLIFMDTPGLNASKKSFDRRLVQQARGAMQDADIVVIMRDALAKDAADVQFEATKGQKKVLVLTKVDKLKDKKLLLPLLQKATEEGWDAVVPLSGLKGTGVDSLYRELVKLAPEGPWLFPSDQVTDMPMALRLAEITREKTMRLLNQELPYGVGVVTLGIEQRDADGDEAPVLVHQQILVAKEQHKPMVLGAKGQMIKEIGTQARKDMQEILGQGVRLELVVKVAERWQEREDFLREMGV